MSLVDQLRAEIRSGKVLAIVGAGVSVGATHNSPTASWSGLLKHGANYCAQLQLALPPRWEERMIEQIESGDVTDMISAAQNIADRLSAPSGGHFRRWLRESVGSLALRDSAAIAAIHGLNIPLATTNYDGLLSSVTGHPPVTWSSPSVAQRWARNDQAGILHLHGHWETPESVVLGIRSYDDILRDEATQLLLRELLYSRTLLFVGFGNGLNDPNFSALLEWSRNALAESEYSHFRLVLDKDLESVRSLHARDRIHVVAYGSNYDDLPRFLGDLGVTPSVPAATPSISNAAMQRLIDGRADLARRKSLLDQKKDDLTVDEFISDLASIAYALAKLGGTKSAVRMLYSPFTKNYASLNYSTRTGKGLLLLKLLLEAGDFEFARRHIQELLPDCSKKLSGNVESIFFEVN